MSNLLLFLLLLACLGISASWIAENPGEVVIHWGDWRIDTSLALIFGAVLAASLAFIITYSILAKILNLPSAWSQNRSLKSYKNGLTELTWTVASLAASDIATAERHAKKAQKLLGNSPMTLLLFAQISRHQGDEGRTQHLLEEMLEHKETEYLAARMLSESAHKQEMLPRALALAQRAQSASPHDGDAVVALVSLNVKMQQWQKALDAVNSAGRKAGMSSGERSHLRGVILLAEALSLAEDEHDETALAIAKKSLKYLPDFCAH
ncbi:MAG: hypothetical protein EBR02_03260 [Alphaproteobacteria bacterium]|nr:hypothetical protein [Alphaproteobacteria bacterium]